MTQINADTKAGNSSSASICVHLRANAFSSSLVHCLPPRKIFAEMHDSDGLQHNAAERK